MERVSSAAGGTLPWLPQEPPLRALKYLVAWSDVISMVWPLFPRLASRSHPADPSRAIAPFLRGGRA